MDERSAQQTTTTEHPDRVQARRAAVKRIKRVTREASRALRRLSVYIPRRRTLTPAQCDAVHAEVAALARKIVDAVRVHMAGEYARTQQLVAQFSASAPEPAPPLDGSRPPYPLHLRRRRSMQV